MDAVGATRRGRAQCEKEEKVQYESAPSLPNCVCAPVLRQLSLPPKSGAGAQSGAGA